ncbi:MAG: hypothetical protein OEO21_11385, partial [Candidatus Krumholzibacteria bacterium]|nr:hypothetical protein [Candidatus Krumholzibacteria bacterium]
MKRILLLAGVAMLAVPAVTPAQEPAPPAREREGYRVFTWNENRGRIGVIVSVEADASTDRLGAR